MLFSVIVPVYNAEKYLEQCIESILKQDFSDFELILVDDGSTDGSADICDRYAADERVAVIHKQNGGSVSARNTGIEASSGEYLCFVDSDDYIAQDFLRNFYNVINNYDPEIIAISCTRFDSRGRYPLNNETATGIYKGEKLCELKSRLIYDTKRGGINLGAIMFSLCCKCIKRSNIPQMLPCERIKLGDDMRLSMPMVYNCSSLYVSDYSGYFYRNNESSQVNTFREDDLCCGRRLVELLVEDMPDHRLQLSYYLSFRTLEYIQGAARTSSDWKNFKRILNENVSEEDLERVSMLGISTVSFKKRVHIFAVRHKLWRLLWIYGRVRA